MPAVETVTVLITDLVGSTGLASRVGPAAADELRHEHFALLREAIAGHRRRGGEEHGRRADGRLPGRRGRGRLRRGDPAADRAPQPHGARAARRSGSASRWATRPARTATTSACRWSRRRASATRRRAARSWPRSSSGSIGGRDGHAVLAGRRAGAAGLPEPVPAYEVAWEPAPRVARRAAAAAAPARRARRSATSVARRSARGVAERWEAVTRRAGGRRCSSRASRGSARRASPRTRRCELHGRRAPRCSSGTAPRSSARPTPPGSRRCATSVEHAPDAGARPHVERHGGELARLVPVLRAPRARRPGAARRPIPRRSATCCSRRSSACSRQLERRGAARARPRRPPLGRPADARAPQARDRRDARRAACS